MKRIYIITLILTAMFGPIFNQAQGIRLTGNSYTEQSTGFHIDTLYSYPVYTYNSVDSIVVLTLNLANSQTNAKAKNCIYNPPAYGIPNLNFTLKSTIGYPTSIYLYNTVKPWLQAAPYNFSVTTF